MAALTKTKRASIFRCIAIRSFFFSAALLPIFPFTILDDSVILGKFQKIHKDWPNFTSSFNFNGSSVFLYFPAMLEKVQSLLLFFTPKLFVYSHCITLISRNFSKLFESFTSSKQGYNSILDLDNWTFILFPSRRHCINQTS